MNGQQQQNIDQAVKPPARFFIVENDSSPLGFNMGKVYHSKFSFLNQAGTYATVRSYATSIVVQNKHIAMLNRIAICSLVCYNRLHTPSACSRRYMTLCPRCSCSPPSGVGFCCFSP